MNTQSPYLLVKSLEGQISSILSGYDVADLETGLQKQVAGLKQEIIDARLDIRDYELSETRDEQLKNARSARKRLQTISANILAVSDYNLFGPADIAQLLASVEQISDRLY